MSEPIESVETFRLRARAWIKANLGPLQPFDLTQDCADDEEELVAVALGVGLDADDQPRVTEADPVAGPRSVRGGVLVRIHDSAPR